MQPQSSRTQPAKAPVNPSPIPLALPRGPSSNHPCSEFSCLPHHPLVRSKGEDSPNQTFEQVRDQTTRGMPYLVPL